MPSNIFQLKSLKILYQNLANKVYTLYPNKQVKQKQIFLLYIQLSLLYIITLYEQETFRENSYICIYIVFNVQYFNSSNWEYFDVKCKCNWSYVQTVLCIFICSSSFNLKYRKSPLRETLTLSMCANSSTNTINRKGNIKYREKMGLKQLRVV